MLIPWLLLTLSSFNTLLPLWLGLTVLLNAERRAWGIWLAGGSLIVTGMFFITHSALLEGSLLWLLSAIGMWWYVGWLPVIVLPIAWYIAMLWFAGFWESGPVGGEQVQGARRHLRKHRYGLMAVSLLGVVILVQLLLTEYASLGSVRSDPARYSPVSPSGSALSNSEAVLLSLYPFYIIACFILSLHALRHLAPSGRVMGDLARRRARPWLVATSLIQIAVSLLVTSALIWIASHSGQPMMYLSTLFTLNGFDLTILLLIAVSLVLLGQAIVSYEIFTGKTLPRQGFRRYWRNAVVLSLGYSALLSLVLTLRLPSVYILLMATVLVALFYALQNWRSYAERDRYLEHLRPFIGSQKLYDQLLVDSTLTSTGQHVSEPFSALCSEILGARFAYLVPLGSLAPLAGSPLVYPDTIPPPAWQGDVAAMLDEPHSLCVPVDPERLGGAVWAIPLWSQRGLIGALLIGEKVDGGLYTQEEIEIARASGERLIDMQAGAEMARRLMSVQRQRLVESQVLDAQTRRVLHDDVLPGLHAVLLSLSSETENEGSREKEEALPNPKSKILHPKFYRASAARRSDFFSSMILSVCSVKSRSTCGSSFFWRISALTTKALAM